MTPNTGTVAVQR